MKRKHKPARPHWEIIKSRRANNKVEFETPTYGWGWNQHETKRTVRPPSSTPGQ